MLGQLRPSASGAAATAKEHRVDMRVCSCGDTELLRRTFGAARLDTAVLPAAARPQVPQKLEQAQCGLGEGACAAQGALSVKSQSG
ncbi:unnamed protein product [Prorocentrum cordatum]|uniref:Uncharacterized protein n=1 Tax=Prorocentrum cordatum TaxID=2364126 RepID=A0ABN9TTQ9_9DINO|nr:unnamed protein product [Polarella glacialis]